VNNRDVYGHLKMRSTTYENNCETVRYLIITLFAILSWTYAGCLIEKTD